MPVIARNITSGHVKLSQTNYAVVQNSLIISTLALVMIVVSTHPAYPWWSIQDELA